jgi:hypothetical protein
MGSMKQRENVGRYRCRSGKVLHYAAFMMAFQCEEAPSLHVLRNDERY